jgi:hypothetical protein
VNVRGTTLVGLAGVLGPVWLWARRDAISGIAAPLSREQRAVLSPYFEPALLEDARVAVVEHIENPVVVGLLEALGVELPMDLAGVSGMCFGDVVVVAGPTTAHGDLSTTFHELVHAVQMRRLGHAAFCREYVRGWLEEGYPAFALETEAYTLQTRFDRGEVFKVR